MESKLFDSRSISEIVCSGRTYSNPFSRHPGGVKISRQLCSCRGIFLKASYSTARTSNKVIYSVVQDNFSVGNGSSRIIGTNGASSTLYSRERSILDSFEDEYGGVVVNPERLPSNPNAFASTLQSSLSHWKMKVPMPVESSAKMESSCDALKMLFNIFSWQNHVLSIFGLPNSETYVAQLQEKKGVWLKLPLERSELVPIAVKEGFEYHHAERGYLMLTYWIPEGPCMLPANASHQVGIGGFVINEKNEVLVVQEKHCAPANAGLWKLPTGFILESEEIFTGAVREIKEETGIDTEFVEVIAFRHAHHVAFEKSDLFFICMLRPLSTHIMVDDLEIQAAKWMPLIEFVEQPLIRGDIMFKKVIDICIAQLGNRYCGLSAHQVISKFDGKLSSLYYNVIEAQDFNCQGG
ncbi:hypothetical protein HHK36_000410 [Tetracentron sinense]|uniref:Nudix hydrolase domain-containing protein n=1 Tax=Tetracentron sinense TaxID=13715 RepID=A0A835A0Z1_TETSI|nr:hypothetical protein HHK36_000410 [Tetracentron sinense]